jgi:1-deoxy-D-xylulose-5-phosphate reductoisomerase
MKKKIAILGSTGSIGKQTLEVIDAYPDMYQVETLTANTNVELLAEQAVKFQPNNVVIADKTHYNKLKDLLDNQPIKVFAGNDSLKEIVCMPSVDLMMAALVGYSGLAPVIEAIKCGKQIALANKETMVVAGELITELSRQYKATILPVDSEHSAIFQCMQGERFKTIEKIILTASGGPFRTKKIEDLENVTVEEALKHPSWTMGKKITIDSATMMNKGLEVIEAFWLFGVAAQDIEVLIHPQSIVHSMVQFKDGSIKAQLSPPNMKMPILYAMSYPQRTEYKDVRLDFKKYNTWTFEEPDFNRFPCLKIAYNALNEGGNFPCAMNAANEAAVEAFLNGKIKFMQIPKLIERILLKIKYIESPTLQQLEETHIETHELFRSESN